MLAAYFHPQQGLCMQETCLPTRDSGQALLQVLTAGICATDLEILAGYQDFQGIPGHEFVGLVLEAPDYTELEGQRVVGDINCGCGVCTWCQQGLPRHCPKRSALGIRGKDGVFAQYLTLPVGNLYPVPSGLEDQQAVWAEPLAAALEVSQQIHITSRMRVAVLGDGKLGLLAALALRHYAPDLLLLGRHASKLRLAAKQGVSTRLVQQGEPLDAQGFDLVVECTGRPQGLLTALELVRPQGMIAIKTTCRQETSLDLSQVVVNELQLLGSRCGDLALALDFLAKGRLDVLPLVQAVMPLAEIHLALELAQQSGSLKVLLECSRQ
ncbi:MAG: MDR/zinc-dependent alcohol dehydrogenase-like family protein [Desulfohalobiaceae bacterium]